MPWRSSPLGIVDDDAQPVHEVGAQIRRLHIFGREFGRRRDKADLAAKTLTR
jgi:hypothetical protein